MRSAPGRPVCDVPASAGRHGIDGRLYGVGRERAGDLERLGAP
jgi:hypothetical protein